MNIATVTPVELARAAAEFHALLRGAVEHGASVGFTRPLADGEVADYWRKVGSSAAASWRWSRAATAGTGRRCGSCWCSRRNAVAGPARH